MSVALRNNIRTKLPHIQQAIHAAEKRIAPPPKHRAQLGHSSDVLFPTSGPRGPWYEGTPIPEVLAHLDRLDLPPHLHFVDLGSGLGNVCFAAAAVFDRVTGLEQNPEFLMEAEKIRFKFRLSHVRFQNQDFVRVPLKPFDVIFFYKPFADDFGVHMRKKLLETAPGTYIISRQIMPRILYDRSNFDYLAPLDSWEATPQDPHLPYADFYTFIRKSKS